MTNESKEKNVVLTERQLQCVKYLLQGKTAREIAEILGLSRRTVEYYLSNVKSRFECNNKVELILALSNLLETEKKNDNANK